MLVGGLEVEMILFIMTALVVGFWVGVFATYKNFVLPVQAVEAGLREELKEGRTELWEKDREWVSSEGPAAYEQGLTEPKIERWEHSDVLFIQVEDLLR